MSASISIVSNMSRKKKNMSGVLENRPGTIAQSVGLRSVTQKGSRYFIAWGLRHLDLSKTGHHEGRTYLRKKIDIIGHAGALMGSTVLRSAGYNDCAVWRKPRPSASRC
jgi:hypothetical protein